MRLLANRIRWKFEAIFRQQFHRLHCFRLRIRLIYIAGFENVRSNTIYTKYTLTEAHVYFCSLQSLENASSLILRAW